MSGSIKLRAATWMSKEERESADVIAMVPPEPCSPNPAMKIGNQLIEVPMIHEKVSREGPGAAPATCW